VATAGKQRVVTAGGEVGSIPADRPWRFVRYIRDTANGNSVNQWNHIVEIQAIDTNGVNVALGKSGDVATDGVVDIYESGINYVGMDTFSKYTLDLGAVHKIKSITVWHFYLDGRTYHNTKLEISTDGENWAAVFDSAVSGEYPETPNGRTTLLSC
jgi:hypothetical protein